MLGVAASPGALGPAPGSGAASVRACPPPVTFRCAGQRIGVRVGESFDEGESAAEDRLRLAQFDAVTFPNFTWSQTEPGPNRWDFRATDAEIAFARRHHLYVTANHFVWDQLAYSSTPAWVNAINDPVRLEAVMLNHISTFTKRYGDTIRAWTVVNEPLSYFIPTTAIHPNHFAKVLGPDWIADAFRIAHRGAPRTALWLNEVFTEDDPAKANSLVELAAGLVARHVPIDGVSLEGHLFTPLLEPMVPDVALVRQTLERLAALGLQVALSEIDAPTLPTTPNRFAVQADDIGGLVGACRAVPQCRSITFWDIDDSQSWLIPLFHRADVDPTLFTSEQRPKPAFASVLAAMSDP